MEVLKYNTELLYLDVGTWNHPIKCPVLQHKFDEVLEFNDTIGLFISDLDLLPHQDALLYKNKTRTRTASAKARSNSYSWLNLNFVGL
jgi:hypothetical protein